MAEIMQARLARVKSLELAVKGNSEMAANLAVAAVPPTVAATVATIPPTDTTLPTDSSATDLDSIFDPQGDNSNQVVEVVERDRYRLVEEKHVSGTQQVHWTQGAKELHFVT